MRRPAIGLMTTILAILTAVTLLRAAAVVTDARIGTPVAGGGKEVARAFFEVIDQAIRTGDLPALDAVMSPDLEVHRSGVSDPWGRAGFAAHIAEIRGAYPGLRIVVDDLMADQDRVFARVRLTGDESLGLRGIPVAATPMDFTDVLRITGDRVVEYHGVLSDLNPPHPVLHETFEAGPAESAALGLARLMIEAGAGFDSLISPGSTVYTVGEGRVSFAAHGVPFVTRAGMGTPLPQIPGGLGAFTVLGAGDRFAISADMAHSIHATEDGPAIVVAMTLMAPNALTLPSSINPDDFVLERMPSDRMYLADDLARESNTWPRGVVSQPLVGGLVMALPLSPFVVTIHRLTLAPSAVIAEPAADGFEMVAVEAGNGVMTTIDHGAEGEIVAMTVGAADVIEAGAVVAIRNAGDVPLVLLLLSFTASDEQSALAIPPVEADRGCPRQGCNR